MIYNYKEFDHNNYIILWEDDEGWDSYRYTSDYMYKRICSSMDEFLYYEKWDIQLGRYNGLVYIDSIKYTAKLFGD